MAHFVVGPAVSIGSTVLGRVLRRRVEKNLRQEAQVNEEDRRRFLVWFTGDFKRSNEHEYEIIWSRVRENERSREVYVTALAGAYLALRKHHRRGTKRWFVQLAESDRQEFEEQITAFAPPPPVEQLKKTTKSGTRKATNLLGRPFRRGKGRSKQSTER